ncbi:NAD(P)H-dependent flavin oxidoreductase [Roseburia sp. MSJ-14]|uniref:NAD(P)H-dependent flavin oxidoreductase n=1 Tax=Roseburia sp. MSJ-14 TaxID=2841514 RepID=UPI001C117AC1|nr:nitronate monooxygenase family protein [Roseburia sp. MSJ-14]MBU5472945.1 nitronate monooxygenase family protein [Roseburia sp. MSJ-14]
MGKLVIRDLVAKIPVIQGGMGVGVSLSKLAGNVAKCGGVGIISTAQIGYQEKGFEEHPIETNLKAIEKHIKRAKEIAQGGVVGVNIMVATKKYEEYVKAAVKAGVDLIISGAGLPTRLPELVEKSKTKIAPIVSSIKSANVICKLWDRKYKRCPDLVVIEGPKAGGHLGFSYEELQTITQEQYEDEIKGIIQVVESFGEKYDYHIPIVTAGGIYDVQDMKHAMELGVDGVQVATRFVTTYECDASDAYKQAYIDAKQEEIQIVKSPVGMPGRAIHNAFIEETEKEPVKIKKCLQCLEHCKQKDIPYCITNALINAVKGKVSQGLIFCGANAWRAKKIEHVSDIMKEFSGYMTV